MKRLLMATVVLTCSAAWSTNAQDVDGRQGLSEEQAKQRQSVIQKYDTDGDGVLSRAEEKELSKADKNALAKTGGVGTARKTPEHDVDKPDRKRERDHDRSQARDHGRTDHDPVKGNHGSKASNGGGGKGKGGKK